MEMANCHLTENIKSSLDKGHVVGAVFLGLKMAFDTVNHDKQTTTNLAHLIFLSKQRTGLHH